VTGPPDAERGPDRGPVHNPLGDQLDQKSGLSLQRNPQVEYVTDIPHWGVIDRLVEGRPVIGLLDTGFAEALDMYRAAGWARSFPLPVRKKDPPPVGITGRDGEAPNFQTVATFRRAPWDSNLGVAMPQDLIGIDVDQYGDKRGAEHLAALEDRLGVHLPAAVRSSSRGPDNPSGIRLYRVPPGIDWKGELCPDVDIISWHDRYAVVWPSTHPEGRDYQWYGDGGEPLDRPPLVAGDHPDLPWQFVAHATKDPDVPADYEAPEARREAIWHPKVTEAFDRFPGTGSRHANARTASMALARYEQLQLDGATAALDELGVRFITAIEDDRGRHTAAAEWGRLLTGARYKARTTESTVLRDRAVGVLIIDPPPSVNGNGERVRIPPPDNEDFWTTRDELKHIRRYAQAQMAAPWATLGAVLARIVCQVPPAVVLPDIINDEASLNLTLALVGRSGDGKGGAVAVARRAVDIGTPEFQIHTLGSGQGIAHGYAHWESGRDGEPGRVVQHATSVMFNVEEVDHLAAHNNQNASTALAELRRFCMGEKLGHLYADRTRRIEIPAHHYRGAVIVGVQPARAAVILNDVDGGTAQRFTWWPTIDHQPPDTEPERPEPWPWKLPPGLPEPNPFTGRRPLEVCQTVWDAVREARRARNRGEGDPLDGHALLTRERIAAALGLLNGHWGITDEDWDLAGQAMAISDATRTAVAANLAATARVANAARAHQEADREEVKEDRQDQRVAGRLVGILRGAGDWVNGSDLRRRITSRDRQAFESAVAKLIAVGQIKGEPTTGPQGQRGIRYRVEQ
jgi:Bifunctional DNA primase/polymerase, N-terminal